MLDFVNQNGNLVLNSLWQAQPVEADKRVGDVVGSTEMILCQSRSRVQHRLQSMDQVDRKTGQHAPEYHQRERLATGHDFQ